MKFGLKNKFKFLIRELSLFYQNNFLKPKLYNLNSSERIGSVYYHPTDMCETDRVMLYALVRGLHPENVLEIGTRWGGSARIIVNAMEDNKTGKLVSLDPAPGAFRVKPVELHGRHILVEGFSPEATPIAVSKLDGPLDLVFIDALHIHDAALLDFKGVIPFLASGGHVLFHDAYHQGISAAIDEVLKADSRFVDCGFITRNPNLGYPVAYQGLRLVRFGCNDSQEIIEQAYTSEGKDLPEFSRQYWNFDRFAIRVGIVDANDCSPGKAKLR